MHTNIFRTVRTVAILAFGALAAQPAVAEDDSERGKLLAYTCMGCHGIEGYRNAYPSYRVPKLGGQRAAYIETALGAYSDGSRPHPTMQAQGGSLSARDIRELAAFFASLAVAGDEVDAETVAGNETAGICVTCHGVAGAGVVPQPPTLSGQHMDYLVHAMQQYRDGSRSGTVMSAFAVSLDDAEVSMLARFYASQDGLHTPVDSK